MKAISIFEIHPHFIFPVRKYRKCFATWWGSHIVTKWKLSIQQYYVWPFRLSAKDLLATYLCPRYWPKSAFDICPVEQMQQSSESSWFSLIGVIIKSWLNSAHFLLHCCSPDFWWPGVPPPGKHILVRIACFTRDLTWPRKSPQTWEALVMLLVGRIIILKGDWETDIHAQYFHSDVHSQILQVRLTFV